MEKINILLADDHKIFLEGVRVILDQDEYLNVLGEAYDGEELLSLLKEYPQTNLVIIDIEMPNMNGIEITKVLRREYPQVRILVLTYHNEEDYIYNLRRMGVNGYVIKNQGASTLIGAIHDIIRYKNRPFPSIKLWQEGSKPWSDEEIHLTKRELDVLRLSDLTSKEIAAQLGIGPNTVNTYLENLRKKFDVDSTIKLLRKAIRLGYLKA